MGWYWKATAGRMLSQTDIFQIKLISLNTWPLGCHELQSCLRIMSAVIRFAQFPLYQNSLKPLLWLPGQKN
jgi:hypothetical protein